MCAHTMKDTWYAHGLNNTNEKYKQEEEEKKIRTKSSIHTRMAKPTHSFRNIYLGCWALKEKWKDDAKRTQCDRLWKNRWEKSLCCVCVCKVCMQKETYEYKFVYIFYKLFVNPFFFRVMWYNTIHHIHLFYAS